MIKNPNEEFTWSLLKGFGQGEINLYEAHGDLFWDPNLTIKGKRTDLGSACRTGVTNDSVYEMVQTSLPQALIAQGVIGPMYDSDRDGILDSDDKTVLITKNNLGHIVAFDLETDSILWINDEWGGFRRRGVGAFINLDNDSSLEYVFPDEDNLRMVALNADGSTHWISQDSYGGHAGYSSVLPVDLNGDGRSDFYFCW